MDTRDNPPLVTQLKAHCPDVPLLCGELDVEVLSGASEIIVSPGLDTNVPPYSELKKQGISIIGDIELFAREAKAPVVAITGSNGKSTVTTLVGEMAKEAGLDVKVGGNIGVPALDLLAPMTPDLYVLELSSFQLETTESLAPSVATVLNLQADHLDRYGNMVAYHTAKQRIYRNCQLSVWNKQDMLTQPLLGKESKSVAFTTAEPDLKEFGLREIDGDIWLSKGMTPLIQASDVRIKGRHNLANALAALALGEGVNLPMEAMLKALTQFGGLPHRSEWVAEIDGVVFINDSKGTNVGATKAAIEGLAGGSNNIVLIAGGVGKGADFSELTAPMKSHCKALIALGEDKQKILDVAPEEVACFTVDSLEQAVELSLQQAEPGDVVLFSPACASFDMFKNFEHRGEAFCRLVKNLGDAL
jgi:UDP-N-acetylmuramoylalanine--D-glutamate ligase